MAQRPRRSNANLHPGQVVIDSQSHRRTSEQKKADDEALQWVKDTQLAAVQKGYERVGAIEDTMADKQSKENTDLENPIKPLKPRPRPRPVSKAPAVVQTASQSKVFSLQRKVLTMTPYSIRLG